MTSPERPFDAIRRHLAADGDELADDGLRLDFGRQRRTGIPEVVLCGRKTTEQIVAALSRLTDANGRALATRIPHELLPEIIEALPGGLEHIAVPAARALVVSKPGSEPPRTDGRVGILTAGTSDATAAAEAALIASEMGCEVIEAQDVGVAGLHRLVRPLEAMISSGIHVLIVAAGMDGALPSVVAGLVRVPVIGLPTSTGYGFGGGGEAALMTMLQSCAPGLVVVNIDNGIGAGATAALIANQARC
ncbi:MAG: nickel pincer cofactor biosynthesis protein LarB [Rhizobiales bacterium]|nr:nickel pincer cofactor biosynthesis protein LarB [Hyphomicrobiales bacterium]